MKSERTGTRKAGGKIAGSMKAPEVEEKPLRPAQCRSHMRRELAKHITAIADALVERAKSGSFQHVKLATDLLDLKPARNGKQRRRGPGPLTQLLLEMERKEAEEKQGRSGGR